MHGRVQREEGQVCKRRGTSGGGGGQHMPATTTRRTVAVGDSSIVSTVTADSFCKDGRKICVGDCALFKPPHDSPPFIGIIRRLRVCKDNNLQLGLNWLYRPAELKLSKGILLDTTPNEIFYSFNRDEIPAASLLHPCKVAFLPKGAELPTGISSFVCRRVYDISNKCLYWLTDKDCINELQKKEVDQLLYKTQVEMHATVQPGGRSPKPLNGPMPSSQLKSGSDNVQSSVASFPSQVKGKKRERGEQGSESIKRERSVKSDDSENMLKSEISKITEEGGLVDCEGAAKLVQLMQPDRVDGKMDLTSRSMLASVVAATDKFDCLARFVQLKGLPVLDGWLQDVHRGRIVEFSNSKDGDISIEEFLLVLLRALDKLPVNLQALQMCNIGKSVNHLRQHKNMEIQRKARSLVDTWKKRVEAEMNIIDSKTGSNQAVTWPSKARLPEASHSGNKNPGGSSDAIRSSVTQFSASKTTSIKPTPVETSMKSASSPGPIKQASSPSSGKVGEPRVSAFGSSDVPPAREDKSSSSSQSHNHSQSFSGKEDARSSTAVSMSSIKISSGGSRHRKLINGGPGSSVSAGQKESSTNRSSSLHRNPATEKSLQSALSGEKTVDVPAVDGGSHKLIVKISNKGRSPVHSVSGGLYEDPTIRSSRASSPVLSEKNDQLDHNSKEKSDVCRSNITFDVNTESWQSNVLKDVLTGSDEGDGSPVAVPEEERGKTVGEGRKSSEVAKPGSSSSGTELKSGKLHEASFSSMNALIESCAKYSEANTSMSLSDAVGMNLLASVATEEMSKSGRVSPSVSPQGESPSGGETCRGDELKSKSSPVDSSSGDHSGRNDGDANGDKDKQFIVASMSWSEGKLHAYKSVVTEFTRERRPSSSPSEETATGVCFNSSCTNSLTAGDLKSDVNEKLGEMVKSAAAPCSASEKTSDGEQSKQFHEEKVVNIKRHDSVLDGELGGHGSSIGEGKVNNGLVGIEDLKRPVGVSASKFEGDNKNDTSRVLGVASTEVASTEVNPPSVVAKSESTERADKEELQQTGSSRDSVAGKDEIDASNVIQSEQPNSDKKVVDTSVIGDKAIPESNLARRNLIKDEPSAGNNDIITHDSDSGLFTKIETPGFSNAEVDNVESRESKYVGVEADRTKECVSIKGETSSSSATAAPDSASKMKFDLNEGFISDEGKYGEPVNSTGPGCLSNVHIMGPSTFAVPSVSSSLPASITVAAAAKGPFVPPEDLLRVKGEFGWKGSAATSAFRPAEPRKPLDVHSSSRTISVSEASTSKHGRPPLDIDLNVADERIFEDTNSQDCALAIGSTVDHMTNLVSSKNKCSGSPALRSFGGLDLDLNRVDEPNDVGQCTLSSSHRLEGVVFPASASSSGVLPTVEVRRDFDLNNGPVVDESSAEQPLFHQCHQGNMRSQLNASGLRMNNPEMGSLSSWFAPGNSYSTMTIPSILPDRGEQQPFPIISPGAPRMLGHSAAGSPFTPDVFRGSVLSSSPAMPFPAAPFQYPVFPFGTTFPLPSATYAVGSTSYIDSSSGGRLFTPPVNSQLLGAVSHQYPRPYVVSLPNASSNGAAEHNRKRSRQGLDLNAGPGTVDLEGKEESASLVSRQLSVAGSQALTDEHGRMYPVAGSLPKRKEPEGGWDNESFRFKQSSWQ